MPTVRAQRGIIGLLNGLIARLRATGGKTWADIITVFVVAALATAAALALNRTTPVRFIENLTYDLRQAIGAPAAKPQFVIVKIDDDALNAMREASACHCLSPIDKIWLADLLAALDAKGVKATAVDYLLDTWDSPEEFAEFQRRIANTKAPIIAAAQSATSAGLSISTAPKHPDCTRSDGHPQFRLISS
jgi:CHASE2 domain-containing sensor protein